MLLTLLQAQTKLKIASYNVENLFDLQKSGYEYQEYIPNTVANWNSKTYKIKLENISRVIKDINADIIALEEIESLSALKDLRLALKKKGLYYQYYKIADYKNTTTKVALLSKIPFLYTHEISVQSSYRYRNLLEAKFTLEKQEFYIIVNHWKSKGGPESMRVISAKRLLKRTQELGKEKNIILLGDFNSHYEEYKIFQRKRRHNDTNGITGINDILGTKEYIQKADRVRVAEGEFYNLWYDAPLKQRYSYIYKNKKEALDNILVSSSLLDKKGLEYIPNSMRPFESSYLFKKKRIYRWQSTRKKPSKHKGKGYSDHLPIIAEFALH